MSCHAKPKDQDLGEMDDAGLTGAAALVHRRADQSVQPPFRLVTAQSRKVQSAPSIARSRSGSVVPWRFPVVWPQVVGIELACRKILVARTTKAADIQESNTRSCEKQWS